MAKRFIDTNLFDDRWFMDLSKDGKLLWLYLITKCDHAGIIEVNARLIEFQTGIKTYLTVSEELGNRLIHLRDFYYFIPKFISFQYPNFPNSKVRQQESAIKRLLEFNINTEKLNSYLTLSKDLAKSYGNGNDNGNDIVIETEIEKNKIGVNVILDLYPVVQDVNTVNSEWDFLNDATRQKVIDHAKMFIQHLKDTKQTEYTPFLENYLTKKMYLAPKMPYEHKIETKSDYDLIRERINNEN